MTPVDRVVVRGGRFQRARQFLGRVSHVAEDAALLFGGVERFLKLRAQPLYPFDLLRMRELRRDRGTLLHAPILRVCAPALQARLSTAAPLEFRHTGDA